MRAIRGGLLLVVPMVFLSCRGKNAQTPAQNLATVSATLASFARDLEQQAPTIGALEAALTARLDARAVRELADLLVAVSDVALAPRGALPGLRSALDRVRSRLGDLPYLKALADAVGPATALFALSAEAPESCPGAPVTCASRCGAEATLQAASGSGHELLMELAQKAFRGIPVGLISSTSRFGGWIRDCVRWSRCDPTEFSQVTRDLVKDLAFFSFEIWVGASLSPFVIPVVSLAVGIVNAANDAADWVRCCEAYQEGRCQGACPSPARVCTAELTGPPARTVSGCCPRGEACATCLQPMAESCPGPQWCGALCCGDGMRCDGAACAPIADGGAADGGAPDGGPGGGPDGGACSGFQCTDGTCIDPSLACNNSPNCPGGEDESPAICGDPVNCCVATHGCPGETGEMCAMSCCCCPQGQACCADWQRGCCAG
jgi:hypothetical protein